MSDNKPLDWVGKLPDEEDEYPGQWFAKAMGWEHLVSKEEIKELLEEENLLKKPPTQTN